MSVICWSTVGGISVLLRFEVLAANLHMLVYIKIIRISSHFRDPQEEECEKKDLDAYQSYFCSLRQKARHFKDDILCAKRNVFVLINTHFKSRDRQ